MCELVTATVNALLSEIGPTAVTFLYAELDAFAVATKRPDALTDLGLDIVASALLNILGERKDGPGLIAAAARLLGLLEGYLGRWDAGAASPVLHRLIHEASGSLGKCVAWARSERTLRAPCAEVAR